MEIKDWVRAARAHKGWTLQQLGEAVGRTKANVGHWESGKHSPSFAQLVQISDATGFPMPQAGTMAQQQLAERPDGATLQWITHEHRRLIDDLEALIPEEAEQICEDIHDKAERMRKYRAYFQARDLAKADPNSPPVPRPSLDELYPPRPRRPALVNAIILRKPKGQR
jgi:transcriptional regulator with XRE-family HTH domain